MTRINTNVGSLNAQKSLQWTNAQLQQALTRLSTGLRINVGKDDPAGLIASEILRSDIVSTQKAITNSERANQMIATADSALGQISLLLHDIRGLVEEAANAGAMSDEQIAANQLQIDAALQSINRVSQTTKFQGRGLLDGTLDFVTGAATIPDIKDLKINQATIGSTGQVDVNTEILTAATQASIQSASGDAKAVATLKFAPRTTVMMTGSTVGLRITALTVGPQMEGVKVTIADTGTESATYDQETKVLALTYDSAGGTTIDDMAALINNAANPDGDISYLFYAEGDGAAGEDMDAYVSGDTLAAPELVFTAVTAGTDFNNVKVRVQGGAADSAAWNASAKEILLTLDNTADYNLDAILALVQPSPISTFFDVTAVAGGSGDVATTGMWGLAQTDLETKPVTNSTITGYLRSGFSAATQAMATISFAPVAAALLVTDTAADTATLDIQSKSLELGKDVLITFVDDNAVTKGAEYADYNSAAKTLDVHYDGGASTVADLLTAINKLDGWTATKSDGDDTDTVDATGQAATQTVVDKLQVAALNPGADYNNLQVRLEAKVGLGAATPLASYDAVRNELVIQVDATDPTDFADIVTAIDGVVAGGVAGGFSANWIKPAGGLDYIYGSKVDVNAVGNTASSGGNTLLADLVMEVAGTTGSEAFNFGVGTSVNQIAAAVNLVSDSTGVWAAQDNGLLSIKSNGYGSKYFTAATITNEGIAGTLKTAMSDSRKTGTDADAKINGITAVADGNLLSIATSTLDMSIEVSAGKVTAFNFTITGGGALFQLGPDVVANQQARMGIQSVNTTRLGGASGKLYQLASGQTASLINNVGLAAKIADDAVTSIINLRGRLGAFQKTTLDTNIKALSDTVVALTEAESSIRDADFAAETSNLTRAQILTQSGMAVLGIANQQPQNVLALLRNL